MFQTQEFGGGGSMSPLEAVCLKLCRGISQARSLYQLGRCAQAESTSAEGTPSWWGPSWPITITLGKLLFPKSGDIRGPGLGDVGVAVLKTAW